MGVLLLSIFIIGIIFLAIKHSNFRRSLSIFFFIIAGVIGIIIAGVAINSVIDEQKLKHAKSLIKEGQIIISDTTLSIGSSGELKGIIKNNSSHTLDELILKVIVTDCPEPTLDDLIPKNPIALNSQQKKTWEECGIVGESIVNIDYLNVPSGQKRAFKEYVSFHNLPDLKPNKWNWDYKIKAIIAAH